MSTTDQADSGAGLAAQREAIDRAVEYRRWELVRIAEDAGLSAKGLDKRPALKQALADLKARRADVLVVAKLDRLSRSVKDVADLLDRAQRERWALVVLDMGIDTSSPNGELHVHILAGVAQWERRMIGVRTREGLAQKRAQGVRLGRPVVLSSETESLIFNLRHGGMTLQRIADHLNANRVPLARGGRDWTITAVHRVLQRRGSSRR